jgi:hypothetical protein
VWRLTKHGSWTSKSWGLGHFDFYAKVILCGSWEKVFYAI